MVFIALNCVLLLCFIYLTYYIDKKNAFLGNTGNTLLVPLLFASIELFLYILVMIFKDKWIDSFVVQLVRIVFCFDDRIAEKGGTRSSLRVLRDAPRILWDLFRIAFRRKRE